MLSDNVGRSGAEFDLVRLCICWHIAKKFLFAAKQIQIIEMIELPRSYHLILAILHFNWQRLTFVRYLRKFPAAFREKLVEKRLNLFETKITMRFDKLWFDDFFLEKRFQHAQLIGCSAEWNRFDAFERECIYTIEDLFFFNPMNIYCLGFKNKAQSKLKKYTPK